MVVLILLIVLGLLAFGVLGWRMDRKRGVRSVQPRHDGSISGVYDPRGGDDGPM